MHTRVRRQWTVALTAMAIAVTVGSASTVSAAPVDPGDDMSGHPGGGTPRLAAGTSQNGWPANSDPSAINIQSQTVPGTSPAVTLRVKAGDVASILIGVARRFEDTVELINRDFSAGYNYRTIEGSDTLSNHASGTAIDLNWDKHPQGSSGTFTNSQVSAIRAILNLCDGVVRWGGDYSGTVDEMHFEINVPPGDASLDDCAEAMSSTPPPAVQNTPGVSAVKFDNTLRFFGRGVDGSLIQYFYSA